MHKGLAFFFLCLVLNITAARAETDQAMMSNFMPRDMVEKLVSELLEETADRLYVVKPQVLPKLIFATRAELQEKYCPTTLDCNVLAVHDMSNGSIHIWNQLQFSQALHISILVHELVHYIQYTNGWFEKNTTDCQRWARSEQQAYRVQSEWLSERGMRGFKSPVLEDQCTKHHNK